MWKYVKTAFANRWNYLALCGGLGFSLLSGRPDVFLPLLAAGEIAYLTFVASHPRYQKYIDVQTATSQQAEQSVAVDQMLEKIMASLPAEARERFQRLRKNCLELREIAADLKVPTGGGDSSSLDSLQIAGLDRLLWVYLRLQFTHFALRRFLRRTAEDSIRGDIERLEHRLAALQDEPDSEHKQKLQATLEDNLKTSRDRLANYETAQRNFEFVELEIDRLENKIKTLAELAVNRREPDFITGEVDQVAQSMVAAEQTMNELDFVDGLSDLGGQAPALLRPTELAE